MPFTEAWIIKMNERFESDRDALFSAYRQSGDHESLGLGMRALGRGDYDEMRKYIAKMLGQPVFIRSTITGFQDINEEESEDSEKEFPVNGSVNDKDEKANDEKNVGHEQQCDVSPKKVEPLSVSSESVRPPVADKTFIDVVHSPEPKIHSENVVTKNAKLVIELVETVDDRQCDPATCVDCRPIPYPDQPKIAPGCRMIYAGPGSGKTYAIQQIRNQFKGRIKVWDTDHMTKDSCVPPRSLIFTNRSDIFASYETGVKIAFLPYRNHWLKQCLVKCPHAVTRWYDDVVANIRRSIVIRGDCWLSDRISFVM